MKQVPGGGSSYNFITGQDANDSRQQLSSSHSSLSQSPPQSRGVKKSQEVTGKVGCGAPQQQQPQSYHTSNITRQSNTQNDAPALYCTEGNQVRTRPSVRVASQKKDQITF